MYYRHLRGQPEPGTMLLVTRADAEYAADILNKGDPLHFYRATPRMMGYEGADYGITKYHNAAYSTQPWTSKIEGKFIEWVESVYLRAMVHHRPIVLQADSRQSLLEE